MEQNTSKELNGYVLHLEGIKRNFELINCGHCGSLESGHHAYLLEANYTIGVLCMAPKVDCDMVQLRYNFTLMSSVLSSTSI